MFAEERQTPGTTLRPLTSEYVDIEELFELFAAESPTAEGVFEYIPQDAFSTIKDAHNWLSTAEAEWEDRESARYGVWVADESLAGAAVLDPTWEKRKASMAVILAHPYWGNGYAVECAWALSGMAFEDLGLEVVTVGYDEGNERSKAAIERFIEAIGGQYDGVVRNATERDDGLVDAYEYSVTATQYYQNREKAGEQPGSRDDI